MRKIIFILILLLLINNAAAQEDWFYNSEALDINLKVSSEAVIKPASSSYNVKYVLVNISFVPQDDINQKILRFETEPEGKIENGAIYKARLWARRNRSGRQSEHLSSRPYSLNQHF